MPTHEDLATAGPDTWDGKHFAPSTVALSALRPRYPDYITPPAVVDESAPVVDLGGIEERTNKYGQTMGDYLGPKLTAKEKRPHPDSYGAKEWPSLDAWPRKGKLTELANSPATFTPWADVEARIEAKRAKAQAEYDATHPQPVEA